MQDEDISSTEFHKVLQEVEKYRILRANMKNQKVRQITKELREELLEERQRGFFTKIHKYFRYPRYQCHLKHEVPLSHNM